MCNAGFSDNHFDEGQSLIKNIHKFLPDDKLIVYDMGLSSSQRHRLEKYCKCEVRTFTAKKYSSAPHVANLGTYAFKPLIINETMHEFGFIFWVDTSVCVRRRAMSNEMSACLYSSPCCHDLIHC